MREERNFVNEALLERYPTIKRTVERARKLGFVFLSHRALFSKRGSVRQHSFYTEDSEKLKSICWTHQELQGWCDVLEEAKKKLDEAKRKRNGNEAD